MYSKNRLIFILALIFLSAPSQNANAWDLLKENNEFAGLRTNYNPSFGPFTEFFPDDGTQKSQDLLDFGFFGLNIVCDTGEKIIRLQYSKWDSNEREWLALPLAPAKRVNIKFGNEKAISWNVSNSEWWEDGSKTAYLSIIFSNPNLFMKKLKTSGTVTLPINADRKDYQLKFITKGFSKYLSSYKKAGCGF